LDWESSTATTTTTKPKDPATSSSSDDEPWLDWAASTTSTKPVDSKTTTVVKPTGGETETWGDWTLTETVTVFPSQSTGTDPGHSWAEWVEVTGTETLTATKTATKYIEVASSSITGGWGASASSSAPVVTSIITSTISADGLVGDWSGGLWSVKADDDVCALSIITSYGPATCKFHALI
jgi:hypothetical protein